MPLALVPVTALLLSVAFLLMGNGLLGVLLPVRALAQSYSAFDIGVLGAAYYLGFGAGCILAPFAVRRVGHIRTFAALTSIACVMTLVHGMFDSRVAWWGARMTTGLCYAALYIVIESWLNERATNENRGFVFSAYTIINLTVLTAGQMMITLASPSTFFLFALSAVLISLSTVPVAMTGSQAPAPLSTVHIRPLYLFRKSPVGVLGCLGVGLANGSFWSLAPVFAQGEAGDTARVAGFMSLVVIAGAAGQWPLGRFSDRTDRRRVIAVACAGAMIAALFLVTAQDYWPPALFVGAFLFGAFAFPIYALCAAHLNDFVEPDGYVEASSGLLLVYAAGAVVGPLLAAALMRLLGGQGLFIFTAGIHALVAGYALFRITRRSLPSITERASFGETLVMTSMIAEIDPRAQPPSPAESGPVPDPAGAAIPEEAEDAESGESAAQAVRSDAAGSDPSKP